jgi:hypothetical protein
MISEANKRMEAGDHCQMQNGKNQMQKETMICGVLLAGGVVLQYTSGANKKKN